MEKIEHSTMATNGINMHIASIGTGPDILFLHGFPDLWFTWRHQLLSLSSIGYRCIAPDLGGYGDPDAPSAANQHTVLHVVGDLVGLLDSLGIHQEPGLIEEDFAQAGTARIIRRFLTSRNSKPPCIPKETGFRSLPDNPHTPSWLSEEVSVIVLANSTRKVSPED